MDSVPRSGQISNGKVQALFQSAGTGNSSCAKLRQSETGLIQDAIATVGQVEGPRGLASALGLEEAAAAALCGASRASRNSETGSAKLATQIRSKSGMQTDWAKVVLRAAQLQASIFVGESLRAACVLSDPTKEREEDEARAAKTIIRDGDDLVEERCWVERMRLIEQADEPVDDASNGTSDSPCRRVSSTGEENETTGAVPSKSFAARSNNEGSTSIQSPMAPDPMPLHECVLLVLASDGAKATLCSEATDWIHWREDMPGVQDRGDKCSDDGVESRETQVRSEDIVSDGVPLGMIGASAPDRIFERGSETSRALEPCHISTNRLALLYCAYTGSTASPVRTDPQGFTDKPPRIRRGAPQDVELDVCNTNRQRELERTSESQDQESLLQYAQSHWAGCRQADIDVKRDLERVNRTARLKDMDRICCRPACASRVQFGAAMLAFAFGVFALFLIGCVGAYRARCQRMHKQVGLDWEGLSEAVLRYRSAYGAASSHGASSVLVTSDLQDGRLACSPWGQPSDEDRFALDRVRLDKQHTNFDLDGPVVDATRFELCMGVLGTTVPLLSSDTGCQLIVYSRWPWRCEASPLNHTLPGENQGAQGIVLRSDGLLEGIALCAAGVLASVAVIAGAFSEYADKAEPCRSPVESSIAAILETLQMRSFLRRQVHFKEEIWSWMPVLTWMGAGATLELLLSGTPSEQAPAMSFIVSTEASSSNTHVYWLWYLLGLVPLIIELILCQLRRDDAKIRLTFHGSSGIQRIDCRTSEGLARMRLGVRLQDPVTLMREGNGDFDQPETVHVRMPHVVQLAKITIVIYAFLSPPSIILVSVQFVRRYIDAPDNLQQHAGLAWAIVTFCCVCLSLSVCSPGPDGVVSSRQIPLFLRYQRMISNKSLPSKTLLRMARVLTGETKLFGCIPPLVLSLVSAVGTGVLLFGLMFLHGVATIAHISWALMWLGLFFTCLLAYLLGLMAWCERSRYPACSCWLPVLIRPYYQLPWPSLGISKAISVPGRDKLRKLLRRSDVVGAADFSKSSRKLNDPAVRHKSFNLGWAAATEKMYQLQCTRVQTMVASLGRALLHECDRQANRCVHPDQAAAALQHLDGPGGRLSDGGMYVRITRPVDLATSVRTVQWESWGEASASDSPWSHPEPRQTVTTGTDLLRASVVPSQWTYNGYFQGGSDPMSPVDEDTVVGQVLGGSPQLAAVLLVAQRALRWYTAAHELQFAYIRAAGNAGDIQEPSTGCVPDLKVEQGRCIRRATHSSSSGTECSKGVEEASPIAVIIQDLRGATTAVHLLGMLSEVARPTNCRQVWEAPLRPQQLIRRARAADHPGMNQLLCIEDRMNLLVRDGLHLRWSVAGSHAVACAHQSGLLLLQDDYLSGRLKMLPHQASEEQCDGGFDVPEASGRSISERPTAGLEQLLLGTAMPNSSRDSGGGTSRDLSEIGRLFQAFQDEVVKQCMKAKGCHGVPAPGLAREYEWNGRAWKAVRPTRCAQSRGGRRKSHGSGGQ